MSAETARQIRAALKQKGWTSRDISVRSDTYSMGSSVDVVIKNPGIPQEAVEKIARGGERIRRDEATGEILGGGNTYIHVSYSHEALTALAEPWTPLVQAALDELNAATEPDLVVRVGTSDVRVAFAFAANRATGGYQLWHEGMGKMNFLEASAGATYVARYMRWQRPERPAVQVGDAVAYSVVSIAHERLKQDVWLAVASARLPDSLWKTELDRCKAAGGWYSRAWKSSPAGFAFKLESDARLFASRAPAEVQPQDTANPDIAARLRALADGMQKDIDDALRPLSQNWTHKRGQQHASRVHQGHDLQRAQRALRALATHHDAGTCPAILRDVRTKKQALQMTRTRAECGNRGHYSYSETDDPVDKGEAAALLRQIVTDATTADQAAHDVQTKADRDRAAVIASLRGSNEPGFFPTPPDLAQTIVAAADISTDHDVLEPSAGIGSLVDACPVPFNVDAIEMRSRFARLIRGASSVQEADFLSLPPEPKYDRVIMNPPFEQQADIDHVRHAWEFLKPGGRLVAIMSGSVRFNSNRKARQFRDWLSDIGGDISEIPAGAFSGPDAIRPTDVSTVLVVADKSPEDEGPTEAATAPAENRNNSDPAAVHALLTEVLAAMPGAGQNDCVVGDRDTVRHNLIHAVARHINTILAIDAEPQAMVSAAHQEHEG